MHDIPAFRAATGILSEPRREGTLSERLRAHPFARRVKELAAVKATYDPDNLVHINQNFAPAKRS